jgi:hypothetical protein
MAQLESPGADGRFVFERFALGDYEFNVRNLPPDVYVKSAVLGESDVLQQGMRVRATTSQRLDVVLGTDTGRINGIVIDEGASVENLQVVLVPEGQEARPYQYRVTRTDDKGRFLIRGAAPGIYRLFAWDVVDPNAYRDPGNLRRFLEKAMSIGVTASSTNTANLRVARPEISTRNF